MSALPVVLTLAMAWHVGLALFERRRERDGHSLARLLLLAEVELLRTLHGEVKRRLGAGREHRCEKLREVEARLEELGGDGTGRDV